MNLIIERKRKGITALVPESIEDLEAALLDERGRLRPVEYSVIKYFSQNQISLFCLKHAVYQIVTTELVEFVRSAIEGYENVIEIGAGNGCLGRALRIPMTDNRMQEWKDYRDFYARIGQPAVNYGADVRRLDASMAINILKPEAVVGAWVTHKFRRGMTDGNAEGVDERHLAKKVKRYVFIGNEEVHSSKDLLQFHEPRTYKFDWLISRSQDRDKNMIWLFDFKK